MTCQMVLSTLYVGWARIKSRPNCQNDRILKRDHQRGIKSGDTKLKFRFIRLNRNLIKKPATTLVQGTSRLHEMPRSWRVARPKRQRRLTIQAATRKASSHLLIQWVFNDGSPEFDVPPHLICDNHDLCHLLYPVTRQIGVCCFFNDPYWRRLWYSQFP